MLPNSILSLMLPHSFNLQLFWISTYLGFRWLEQMLGGSSTRAQRSCWYDGCS